VTAPNTPSDTGTGYGRPASSYDPRLTDPCPGTPMGEAMRRYWHPIAISSTLTSDRPHRTRLLGEDLIVFRDGNGRAGVVFERCAHRGTSLSFGRIEDDGIRCCYHGMKFDTQGHCLEQACEPERGRRRDAIRQPWYPVEERYGLVFVYMGPPDRKPALPRYDFFEPLEEGDVYVTELPIPGAGVVGAVSEWNWLQSFENAVDPVHAMWLHHAHSGPQFAGTGTTGFPEDYFDPYTCSGKIKYSKTERGVKYHDWFEGIRSDGTFGGIDWVVEVQVPNLIVLPDFVHVVPNQRHDCIIWLVPVDNTTHRFFTAMRAPAATAFERLMRLLAGALQDGRMSFELTPEELQRFPGDFEAQGSQGPVTQHSEENLVSSDRGVVMLRSMLRQMVDDVEAGKDPLNVSFDPNEIRGTESGVYSLYDEDVAREPTPVAGA
jgi:phenylpropionate dioxygenase-like ring-hydroxylating dioxygenase large terminal subunit